MRKFWLIGLGVLAALLTSLHPPAASLAEKPAAAAEKPVEVKKFPAEIEALNSAARRMYAGARNVELAGIPAVIFATGDDLVLRRGDKRTVVTVVPTEYHTLKGIAHSTIGLFSHLAVEPGKPLSEERLKAIKEFQTLLTAAGPAVEKFGFDADTLTRQKRMIDRAQQLVKTVLADGKVSAEELGKFCRGSRDDVLANGRAAARSQLLIMHKQMMEWKKDMSAEEWSALTVIVASSPQARADNLAVQYFARLFAESPGESRRVVFAESLWDEEAAINMLGTFRLDGKLAAAMFADRYRLYRDFLADGARTEIDSILAPP